MKHSQSTHEKSRKIAHILTKWTSAYV